MRTRGDQQKEDSEDWYHDTVMYELERSTSSGPSSYWDAKHASTTRRLLSSAHQSSKQARLCDPPPGRWQFRTRGGGKKPNCISRAGLENNKPLQFSETVEFGTNPCNKHPLVNLLLKISYCGLLGMMFNLLCLRSTRYESRSTSIHAE
jgi:hypothetical protein